MCSKSNYPLQYYSAKRYIGDKLCLFGKRYIFRLFEMQRLCFKACKHEVRNQEPPEFVLQLSAALVSSALYMNCALGY